MLYFRVITKADEELVYIYYSALNFQNVMTATRKTAVHVASDRLNQVSKSIFLYSETNMMHFLFNVLRIVDLCMFRTLPDHPQEAQHK
jgi:hypothetical protein